MAALDYFRKPRSGSLGGVPGFRPTVIRDPYPIDPISKKPPIGTPPPGTGAIKPPGDERFLPPVADLNKPPEYSVRPPGDERFLPPTADLATPPEYGVTPPGDERFLPPTSIFDQPLPQKAPIWDNPNIDPTTGLPRIIHPDPPPPQNPIADFKPKPLPPPPGTGTITPPGDERFLPPTADLGAPPEYDVTPPGDERFAPPIADLDKPPEYSVTPPGDERFSPPVADFGQPVPGTQGPPTGNSNIDMTTGEPTPQPTPQGGTQPLSMFGHDISERGPRSYSGIGEDASRDLLSAILPQMRESILNMPENIDKYTSGATELFNRTANQQLKAELPGYLDKLSAGGVLNSDIGKEAIQGAITDIVGRAAEKSYGAGMEGAKMKYNIPSLLSTPLSQTRYSESTNELAPFELMWNSISELM